MSDEAKKDSLGGRIPRRGVTIFAILLAVIHSPFFFEARGVLYTMAISAAIIALLWLSLATWPAKSWAKKSFFRILRGDCAVSSSLARGYGPHLLWKGRAMTTCPTDVDRDGDTGIDDFLTLPLRLL